MAVNGIEIEVGQVWRTREGGSANIISLAGSEHPWYDKRFPVVAEMRPSGRVHTYSAEGAWDMCDGEYLVSPQDLVELVSPAPAKELLVQFAEQSANATQVGGTHYKTAEIQPWDYIVANGIGFLAGNVIKYVSRFDKKNGVEDLKKARHYLDKLIETEQAK